MRVYSPKSYRAKLSTLVSLTCCVLFLGSNFAKAETADKPVYKVGVILALTGDGANIGTSVKRGIELAYDQLPAADKENFKIIVEDDQMNSARAVSAFQKLTNVENVDAVLVMTSGVGNAVGPLAERAGKVLIAIGASDTTIGANKQFVFTHWVSAQTEGRVMAEETKKRGYKRIAAVTQEQEGLIALNKAFTSSLKKVDGAPEIALDETVLGETRDFRALIAKIRAKKVDGISVGLLPGPLSAFAKQAEQAGMGEYLFGFEMFEDESEVKAADGALLNRWYVNASDPAPFFKKLHKAKYDIEPRWAAANGYDALMLLADGFKQSGKDNKKIAEYVNTIKDKMGASGKFSATGQNTFELPATVKIVTKDGFQNVYPSE